MIVRTSAKGIRYSVRNCGSSAGFCALSIKVGTRDEEGFPSGIAHFMEHTIFKGTQRKSAAVVNSYLERGGGELNAFTAKEEIVIHAATLRGDIRKAVALLLEIAGEATFPEDEIEIEKGVVLDEIASYKDSPSEDIYDCFEEKLFEGSALSKPILGTPESVQSITSSQLRAFRDRFFTADRMILTVVAPLDEEKMAAMVEKCIASCKIAGCSGAGAERAQLQPVASHPFDITVDKGNNEVNCVMGGIAPAAWDTRRRIATILLCNMLGGPASNSMLGAVLRERHGWVYNVECGYTPYSDTGIATIQFGCDSANLKRCLRSIRVKLNRLQDHPLSARQLSAAKRQLLGQNAIGMDSGEAQCISMGKSLMSYGKILGDKEIEELVNAVSAEDVMLLAREIFSAGHISTLIYL